MPRRNKKDDLDTETTFVNMNVDGFKWYDPELEKHREEEKRTVKRPVPRREYWKMVRAAFAAALPYVCLFALAMGIMVLIAYIWTGMI